MCIILFKASCRVCHHHMTCQYIVTRKLLDCICNIQWEPMSDLVEHRTFLLCCQRRLR
jgi:hypothetical protein